VALAATDGKWVRGWWFNRAARMVGEGVTDGHQSARTPYTDAQLGNRYGAGSRVSMSQGPGNPWFASEADALRALHYAVAQECAELLAGIEARVEAKALTQGGEGDEG
jgi:hypothetical protein